MAQMQEVTDAKSRHRLPRLQSSETTTLFSIISSPNPFRNRWYPVAPVADLPRDRPYGIELFNTPLVVFHDAKEGVWRCLLDRCRHRAVSLSCGKLDANGNLRCLYHGWTYDGTGRCVDVPSIANFRPQDKLKVDHFAACVYARIVWVFAGAPDDAQAVKLPPLPWHDPTYYACLFVRDTEFDWLIYNEHNVDREHLRHVHPKTLSHMPPSSGAPVRASETESGVFYKQIVGSGRAQQEAQSAFFPPSTTLASAEKDGKVHGISFTVTPLGYGRCRVIFLLFASRRLPVPDFLFHITFARVTEEDAVLIRSQMTHLARADALADEAFMNVGADVVARDYRAWLRSSGGGFWQRELNQRVREERPPQARTLAPESASLYRKWEGQMHIASRYSQHFTLCRTCQRVCRRFVIARAALITAGLLAGVGGSFEAGGTWFLPVLAGAVCFAMAFAADHFVRVLRGQRF